MEMADRIGHVHTFTDLNLVQRAHCGAGDCDSPDCPDRARTLTYAIGPPPGPLPAAVPARGAEARSAAVGASGHTDGMKAASGRLTVPPGLTDNGGKVPCGCTSTRCAPRHAQDGCAALRSPGSKACRPCYLDNVGSTERKYEAAEHGAMLARVLASAGRRAKRDDPGQGLAMLVEAQRRLDALVAEVGAEVYAAYMAEFPDGLSAMAADLSVGTGQSWSRQRVWKRWAPKDRKQVPADA
jgi:hypothetical protein